MLAKPGLFQRPHGSLSIGVALGIVVARNGLVDLWNAAGLHESERCGLTALVELATGVPRHKRVPVVAALPGRSTAITPSLPRHNGLRANAPLAGPEWAPSQFRRTRVEACAQYAQFVHDGQANLGSWNGLRNQIYLRGEDFVARMQARLRASESLDEIPKVQRHPVPQWLQAIAAYFGVHSSTVSR